MPVTGYRYIKNIQSAANQLARNDIWTVVDNGAPTSGATGTGNGMTGLGSTYIDWSSGASYLNVGTKASPNWIPAGGLAVSGNGGDFVLRQRVPIASINAGLTLLPAISGLKYRINDITMIAVGGGAAGATAVTINATQAAAGVVLDSVTVGALTQSTVNRAGAANNTVLADGASFAANDAGTAITMAKTGGALTTSTNIDVIISYSIEK